MNMTVSQAALATAAPTKAPVMPTKPRRKRDKYAYRNKLPFMMLDGQRAGFWCVKPSGDYVRDFTTGREYALQFWKVCGKHCNMGLDLSEILLAIHDAKKQVRRRGVGRNLSGIEIGFVRTIGELFQASIFTTLMVSNFHVKRPRGRRMPKINATRDRCQAVARLVGIIELALHPSPDASTAERAA
jgi:hypothetical protein